MMNQYSLAIFFLCLFERERMEIIGRNLAVNALFSDYYAIVMSHLFYTQCSKKRQQIESDSSCQ